MKKKLLIILAAMFGMTLATGCGENPGPGPDPTPTHVTKVSLNKNTLELDEGGSETLIATVEPTDLDASKKLLTWTSDNESIAMVNGTGKVLGLSVGTTTIKATSVDVPTIYASCTVKINKKDTDIHVTGVTLNPTSMNLDLGSSGVITATIAPENATNRNVVWTCTPATGVIELNNGLVKGVGEGTATVTATTVDGNKTATCTVSVKDPIVHVNEVKFDRNELVLTENGRGALTATVLPENASNKDLEWVVTPSNLALVTDKGEVLATGVGEGTIKAISKENSGKFASCRLVVNDGTVHVNSVSIPATKSAYVGIPFSLAADVQPSNAKNKTISWTVEKEDVLLKEVVSDNVVSLTGLKEGTSKVTVTTQDGNKTAECLVTVSTYDPLTHVTNVTLNKEKLELQKGQSSQLTATVLPEDADDKSLVWTVDPNNIAVVDTTGKVVAMEVGTATIKATSNDNPAKYAECSLTVTQTNVPVTGVSIDQTLSLDINETKMLTPVVAPENATNKAVTFEIDDETVVSKTISGSTIALKGLKKGSATLTVKTVDGAFEDTCKITVNDPVVHVETIEFAQGKEIEKLYVGDSVTLTPILTPANPTNPALSWTTDNNAVAVVSSQGVVLGVGDGSCNITATSVQDPNVSESIKVNVETKDTRIHVTKVEFTQDPKEISIKQGTSEMLAPVVSPAEATDKSLTWTSNTPGTVSVVSGMVTGLEVGEATITATSVDNTEAKDTITVKVLPASSTTLLSLNTPANITAFNTATADENMSPVENLYEDKNASLLPGNFFKPAEGAQLIYKVGSQNPFKCMPSANVRESGSDATIVISNPKLNYSLQKYESGEYETVDFDTYASLLETNEIQFKEEAVGGQFKLVLTPSTSVYYVPEIKAATFTLELQVVEGYNVYNLAQLSLFDNTNDAWSDYKTAQGLSGVTTDALIFQQNIAIDGSILPRSMVYTAEEVKTYTNRGDAANDIKLYAEAMNYPEATKEINVEQFALDHFVNSPRDMITLFNRNTNENGFSIEGNFFSIDASTLKEIAFLSLNGAEQFNLATDKLAGDDGAITKDGSHSQLFGINQHYSYSSLTNVNDVNIQNLQLIGNGALSSIGQKGKGGYIGIKARSANLNIENSIFSKIFTGIQTEDYFTQLEKTYASYPTVYSFDRIKAYDTFNAAFYLYNSTDNIITNSWLTRSGGPLIILDEFVFHEDGDGTPHWYDFFQVNGQVVNSYLDNKVTGEEPWFVGHNAGALVSGAIIGMGIYTGLDKAFIGDMAAGVYAATSGALDARTIATKNAENVTTANMIALLAPCADFLTNTNVDLNARLTISNGEGLEAIDANMKDVSKNEYGKDGNLLPGLATGFVAKGSMGGHAAVEFVSGSPVPSYDPNPLDGGAPTLFMSSYMAYYIDPILVSQLGVGRLLGAVLKTGPISPFLA